MTDPKNNFTKTQTQTNSQYDKGRAISFVDDDGFLNQEKNNKEVEKLQVSNAFK